MTASSSARYGSDVIVDLLKALGIEYVALNPGSSFRGIHDSIVNYGGNRNPELIECNHEEISVAIAHGYAKASGKPMAAIMHNVVGLLHASMAIYNAWCDRAPILLLGGGGPMDTTKRRPWIDWIHSALVQGNLVRDFVKWDDQPASVESFADSMLRAWRIAITKPQGPVYICFDMEHQEAELLAPIPLPDVKRYSPPSTLFPDPTKLEEAADWLVSAKSPVIVPDLMGRKEGAVNALIELAELLAAPVIDRCGHFNFPSTHPLDLTGAEAELLTTADLVFALDVNDLHGSLHKIDTKPGRLSPRISEQTKVVHISLKEQLIHSWTADFQQLPRVDLPIAADSVAAVNQLLPLCHQLLQQESEQRKKSRQERRIVLQRKHEDLRAKWQQEAEAARNNSPISLPWLAAVMWEVIKDEDWIIVNGNLGGWPRRLWDWHKHNQYLGTDGGGAGLGHGIGASVGAALAYRDTGKLCIDFQADGDFLFCPQTLWTAAHHRIPLLIIMDNNRTYLNSENHQAKIARQRNRPIENRGIGTLLTDPAVDFSSMARSMGINAEGPIDNPAEVKAAIQRAVRMVKDEKQTALVDVLTDKGPRY